MIDAVGPGDIILHWQRGAYALAKVDLVRPRHFTCFPWSLAYRKFEKGRKRIERTRFVALLPTSADLAAISERLTVLKNLRDSQCINAERRYRAEAYSVCSAAHAEAEAASR